jgi:putative heme-binding domain-containing protein
VGVAFTTAGDMFASGTFLAPNSMGAGLRDALIHCVDGGEYPVRDRVLNEHKRTGDLLPPLTHLGVSAASDLAISRAGRLGHASLGDLFSAQFNLHKVLRHRIAQAEATFTCRNEDFLTSADADFHPTDVLEDADGSLLVVNTGGWFRIGCPTSQVAKPEVLGAIYRVRLSAEPVAATIRRQDPRGLRLDLESMSPEALAKLLADSRFAVRDRAMAKLAKLGEPAVAALAAVIASDVNVEARASAVWTLARIDGPAARSAVRGALASSDAEVRQAAARTAGLHRDADATSLLMQMVVADTPSVRREAATALGRIGDRRAVPALLEALTAPVDRFLEHAVIFALIQLNDRPATLAGLQQNAPGTKRGALVALDQMEAGQLTPELVTPFLSVADPVLQQTALWVIAHHREWGREVSDFFAGWLARSDMDQAARDELRRQLAVFATDPSVSELVGRSAAADDTPLETRLLLLEVMGQAPITKLPRSWLSAIRAALDGRDEGLTRQAIATVRALPLDKRPVALRIDPQVNFAEVLKDFAGTKLAENFCVRWQGVIRIPSEGKYTFTTASDDGSELFIDGQRVVDNSGSHAVRERQGQVKLTAGDHDLRLDFVQQGGEAACILSWATDGQEKQPVPSDVLFHHDTTGGAGKLVPGLEARYFDLGGRLETFPDPALGEFDQRLIAVAGDTGRTLELRVQAAAAVAPRLPLVSAELFSLLTAALDADNPPLVRLDAAAALGESPLDDAQRLALADRVATVSVLELPKLLGAFEGRTDAALGSSLVAALGRSPGLQGLSAQTLTAALANYPDETRQQAEPLVSRLAAARAQQRARLSELAGVLTGGDVQRGRELFFANKKAICASCHAVQGQGGQFGPDLSKIGAIRAPGDLLEAIVLPSASFARGYEPFNVVTTDGQVIAGIIGRETADAIHVVGSNRVELRVPRAAIDTIAQSTTSIMPEGMDNQLSRQDLADLIAFLGSLR